MHSRNDTIIVTTILAAIILGLASLAEGAELRLLSPSRLTMEYYSIANNRDEYLRINDEGSSKYDAESQGETWAYGSAVRFNLDLVRMDPWGLYWDNHVHMAATQAAVRHVGWEFEGGIRRACRFEAFYYHHSQHVLDLDRGDRRYPLVNQYGVRVIFIGEGCK